MSSLGLTLTVFADTSDLLIAVWTVVSRLLTAISPAMPTLVTAIATPNEYRSSLMRDLLSAEILAVEFEPVEKEFGIVESGLNGRLVHRHRNARIHGARHARLDRRYRQARRRVQRNDIEEMR